jgi:hypothetical protein
MAICTSASAMADRRTTRRTTPRRLFVYTAAELNSIALPEATFNTRLYRVVPALQLTPFLTWVNNVQYDTVSGVAGCQSRFRWIVRPGNDIYYIRLHAQLARRSAAGAVRDAGPAAVDQSRLHVPLLGAKLPGPEGFGLIVHLFDQFVGEGGSFRTRQICVLGTQILRPGGDPVG